VSTLLHVLVLTATTTTPDPAGPTGIDGVVDIDISAKLLLTIVAVAVIGWSVGFLVPYFWRKLARWVHQQKSTTQRHKKQSRH